MVLFWFYSVFMVFGIAFNCLDAKKLTFEHLEKSRIEAASLRPVFTNEYIMDCEMNICTNVRYYPLDVIKQLVQDKPALQQLSGYIFNQTFGPIISGRDGVDVQKWKQFCRTKSPTLVPLVMRNIDLKWRYIVNVDDMFKQHLFVEYCWRNETTEPDDGCYLMFNSFCEQRYQTATLLVYENYQLLYDKFEIPTTCECSCTPRKAKDFF